MQDNPQGKCIWESDAEDPGDPGQPCFDDHFKRWLVRHLDRYSTYLGEPHVELTKAEYAKVVTRIKGMCYQRRYLRATEKSNAKKRREFQTLCIHEFEKELQWKRERMSQGRQRDGQSKPKAFDSLQRNLDRLKGARDSG